MNQYTIIACPGHFFRVMLRAIRCGNYKLDDFKIVGLTGDLSEKDLLSIAKNLALSAYLEGPRKGIFAENIANAFILKGDITECMNPSRTGVFGKSILSGISVTVPNTEDKEEQTVKVYSSEEIRSLENWRNP